MELVRWGRGRQPAKLAGWVIKKSEEVDANGVLPANQPTFGYFQRSSPFLRVRVRFALGSLYPIPIPSPPATFLSKKESLGGGQGGKRGSEPAAPSPPTPSPPSPRHFYFIYIYMMYIKKKENGGLREKALVLLLLFLPSPRLPFFL